MLEGIDDPDAAEALRGGAVMVAAGDLPPLKAGRVLLFQLVGCEVVTTDGRRLGAIEEVISTGANDVWVVRDGAREVLVPVIERRRQSDGPGGAPGYDRSGTRTARLGSAADSLTMEFHVITLFPELFAAARLPG